MSSESTHSHPPQHLVEPILEQQIRSLTDWVPHLTVSLSCRGNDIPHTRATDVVDQLMMATLWQ
eukprot:7854937-Pyramimonas_sp.AAC.1